MKLLYRHRKLVQAAAVALAVLLLLALLAALPEALRRPAGLLTLGGLLLGAAVLAARLRRWVPRRTILELDLERGVVERLPDHPAGRLLAADALVLRDVVDALHRAASDRRVVGLLCRLGESGIGLAQAQELRRAVTAFRAAHKPAVAYAESFGELGRAGTRDYYLATAFDEVYLQPVSPLGLVGLRSRVPFVRRLLDDLEITPRLDHREEYKSAMYTLTETELTDPHREEVSRLLESQLEQIVAGVAADRDLEPAAVRRLVDQGPLLPEEAVAAGLVDALGYRHEVYGRMKEETSGELLHLGTYLRRAGRPDRRGSTVALVYGVGVVTRGTSRFATVPVAGITMGADDVTAALRAAIRDRRVKAIVFRIDSPGGSAAASETIWRETQRARQAGKPLVVSFGDVAASGGYYVAMGADRIVAHPGTVTGSIGVVAGKLLSREAWRKLGVTWDDVQAGANAAMWSSDHDFTPAQWGKFQAMLDLIYHSFIDRVAAGRGMPRERVHSLAKGRIWSGADAQGHGLVDQLGGLREAVDLAKEAAGIPAAASVRLQVYPRRRLPWAARRPDSSDAMAALLQDGLRLAAPLGRIAAALGADGAGVLRAPDHR